MMDLLRWGPLQAVPLHHSHTTVNTAEAMEKFKPLLSLGADCSLQLLDFGDGSLIDMSDATSDMEAIQNAGTTVSACQGVRFCLC